MKRIFDILLSGIGLLLLSPLFFVLSLWIKSDSPGPVFYKQRRVGRGNQDFVLYKFRSMAIGADRKGLRTVGGHGPRVTRSGYYIRKYKFDELPQLINVFKGDMSLVGPRPEVRKYVEMYTPEQMKVLTQRPGITDPASIKYRNENELLATAEHPEEFYTKVIMQDKLAINLQYLESRTLFKDFKIILNTFVSILK